MSLPHPQRADEGAQGGLWRLHVPLPGGGYVREKAILQGCCKVMCLQAMETKNNIYCNEKFANNHAAYKQGSWQQTNKRQEKLTVQKHCDV